MANATIHSEDLSFGPGRLLDAPVGTPLPQDLTSPLDAAFNEIGSTEEGSTFTYQYNRDAAYVAESYKVQRYRTTGTDGSVSFAMAENTVRNLTRAFNGGTVRANADSSFSYIPPEPGQEGSRSLVWESEDNTERWVYAKVTQTGAVAMSRKKGADKTTLPVELKLEDPGTGIPDFAAHYAVERSGGIGASE